MNSIQILASKANGWFKTQRNLADSVVSYSPKKTNNNNININNINNEPKTNSATNLNINKDPQKLAIIDESNTEEKHLNQENEKYPLAEETNNQQLPSKFYSRFRSLIIFFFNVIIFFPNLLIFRPLLYLWFVITFPLRFLEERYSSTHDNKKENAIATDKLKDPNDSDTADKRQVFSSSSSTSRSPSPNYKHNNNMNEEYDDLATINSIATNNSVISEINQLKSPTSPLSYSAALFAKLPKVFFSPLNFNPTKHQRKTLILDLDETLIHSLSKTNRMSTAHMVEVRLNSNLATLYYVYKRPFCDEFLRLVSNWFDVYIFTASAKEYADPVINWLERDRPYFAKRFYRDNCTLRQGAGYIKDLSVVGVELSKVILVDNSPISYSLNYENAIDIEGWIDDPTDNELLQLLPLLNSLRFATDVRYILGLKNGEDAFK